MGLDIRLPIGLLLSINGVFLTGYGIFADPSVYKRSLGLNVNLGWGAFLLLVGAILVMLAIRRRPSE